MKIAVPKMLNWLLSGALAFALFADAEPLPEVGDHTWPKQMCGLTASSIADFQMQASVTLQKGPEDPSGRFDLYEQKTENAFDQWAFT